MRTLLLFWTALITQLGFTQFQDYQPKYTTKSLGLMGKVKAFESLTSTIQIYDFKGYYDVDTNAWFSDAYVFDENGNCLERTHYSHQDSGKVAETRVVYAYDIHQHLTESKYYNKGKQLERTYHYEYVYNEQAQIVEALLTESDANGMFVLRRKRVYTYLADGFIEQKETDLLGGPDDVWTTLFNPYGVHADFASVRKGTHDEFGRLVIKTINEQGQVLEEEYKWNNERLTTFYFTYDAAGRVIEKSEEYPDPKRNTKSTYVYNSAGLVETSTTLDYKGNFLNQYKTFYDEWGNEIRVITMKNFKKVDFEVNKSYTYDAQNNWLICLEIPTTQYLTKTITERTISYY